MPQFSRTRLESCVCLLVVAIVFAGLTLTKLQIGTFRAMGPGFLPLILSGVLAILAIVILFQHDPSDDVAPISNLRAFAAVIGSLIVFAFLIPRIGLFLSTAICVTIAATGSKGFSWLPIILLGLGAASFCSLIFIYGLSLPIPLIRSPF